MLYVSFLEPGRVLFTRPVAQTPTTPGQQYITHLTRFYAKKNPAVMVQQIVHFAIKSNLLTERLKDGTKYGLPVFIIRVGGIDSRKEAMVGNIEVEVFNTRVVEGSFICMIQNKVSFEDMAVSLL